MPTRAEYKKWTWQYRKRKAVMEEHLKGIDRKLKEWEGIIKKYEAPETKLNIAATAIREYMGVNLVGIGRGYGQATFGGVQTNPKLQREHLAASIFSKYVIENGVPGTWASSYMSRPPDTAARLRLTFTRSWASKPQNKEMYKEFKEYIKRIEGCSESQ